MNICRTIAEFQQWRAASGGRLALAPTMGALHEGHLSLMRAARGHAERVAVSIFVNPAQFGPGEDFERYPRDFERDERFCRETGVDCVFYPARESIYPPDYCTWINVERLTESLEGAARPGHFRGVATIVLKLFNITRPDVALFGWKDAQQFIVLRKMVEDLNLPVEMIPCEIVREPDGLALSSRNAYLTGAQRREATALYRALQLAADFARKNPAAPGAEIQAQMRQLLEAECSGAIDYLAVVSQTDLSPLDRVQPGRTLIALAVRFGATRLLDNIRL